MKLIKVLGALAVVLGLFFGISASAELAGTPLTDDFNGFTTDVDRTSTGYPASADESAVFAYSSTYSKNYGHSTIKTGAGPDGSTALVLGGRGTDVGFMSKAMDTTGTMVYEFSFDVKFSRWDSITIADNSMWSASKSLFKLTEEGKVQTTSDGSAYTDAGTYAAGEWYKVIVIRTGTKKSGYLIDSQGNAFYSTLSNDNSSASAQISTVHMGWLAASRTKVTIDNAKIASYDTETNAPSYVVSSVEDEGEDIQRNIGLTFEFDQAILPSVAIGAQAADAVTLKETESENPVTVTCTKTAYNKISVTYTGLLAKGMPYTVAFPGVTNGELACTDTIAFTTEEMHVWNDVTVSTVAANTGDPTKTDITFTIADEYGYPTFEGMAMAVVYVPYPDTELYTMTKADMVSANGATGARTLTFALGTIPSNAKICVILLDTTYGPIPVASGMYE